MGCKACLLFLFFFLIGNILCEKVPINRKLGPNVKKSLRKLEKVLLILKFDELTKEHSKFIEKLENTTTQSKNYTENEQKLVQVTINQASTLKNYPTPSSIPVPLPPVLLPPLPPPLPLRPPVKFTPRPSLLTQVRPKLTTPFIPRPVIIFKDVPHKKIEFLQPVIITAKKDQLIRSNQPLLLSKNNIGNSFILINKFVPEMEDLEDEDDEDETEGNDDVGYDYEKIEKGDFVYEFKDDDDENNPAMCMQESCPIFSCDSNDEKTTNALKNIVPLLETDKRSGCGKTYIFSHVEQTFENAGLSCCKENMNLVSIETQEENTCLQKLYKDEIKKGDLFWSSGRYLQCPHRYRWCSSLVRFTGSSTWLRSDKTRGGECVSLKFNKTRDNNAISFIDDSCQKKMKYICETETDEEAELKSNEKPPCKVPNCPELDCEFKPATGMPNGYKEACGKKYVFFDDQVSYIRSAKTCCGLGLKLVSVNNKEEQDCLTKLFISKVKPRRQIWVSGVDLGCEGRYLWCGNQQMFNTSAELEWMYGEPNNLYKREDCITLVNDNETLKLNDELCENRNPFICEAI